MSTLTITLSGGSSTTPMPTYRYYTDGGDQYREGVRGGQYVLDKLLPGGSWTGVEGVDWENLETSE
jgi:hypothetical protein